MDRQWLSSWSGQHQAALCSGMADGEKRPAVPADFWTLSSRLQPKLLTSGIVTCSGNLGMFLVHRQDKNAEVDPMACMFWRACGPTSGGIVQHLHIADPDEAFRVGAGFYSGLAGRTSYVDHR